MDTKLSQQKETKHFTIVLKTSSLVAIALSSAVILTAFFILGVLIGRGYQPEETVPELARIMPKPPIPDENGSHSNPVLLAEELQYADALQSTGDEMAGLPDKVDTKAAKKKAEEKKKQTKNRQPSVATEKREITRPEVTQNSWVHKGVPEESLADSKTKVKKSQEAVVIDTPDTPADAQQFNYRYQVASFKELERAREFQEKLKGLDLFSELEYSDIKKTRWFRVLVLHQGTPESTRAMKNKLGKIGIKKPLLKSKKAVN
ncbi:MAG: SPOR domain-containing protein [Desulfovibrio sp.]